MNFLKTLLKRYILAGLLVLIPFFLTGWVVVAMVKWTDQILRLLPAAYRPEVLFGFKVPGLGLIVSFVLLVTVGAFVANVFGRQILAAGEGMLEQIPLLRWFYFSSKHILEAVFLKGHDSFRRVVMVEYPRKGLYSLGFVTGEAKGHIDEVIPGRCYTLFMPTTPNPTSGFLIIAPESEMISIPWSVDDAFRYIVSAGVLLPGEALKDSEGRIVPPESPETLLGKKVEP